MQEQVIEPQQFEDFFKLFYDVSKDARMNQVQHSNAMAMERDSEDSAPEAISSFLASASLLYKIPFQYLVPRADMLPYESIRFFYVDPNWMFALLDGALSLGRHAAIDFQHDEALIESIYQEAIVNSQNVRPQLQKKERIPRQALGTEVPMITGFLLNSALVKGYRGVEFKAYSGQNVLRTIRLDTLSDTILIGLFYGEMTRLEIKQPPESFHFGVSSKNGGGYEKTLRNMTDGSLTTEQFDVILRDNSLQIKTVDFKETAQRLGSKLGISTTSADMALQMIRNAYAGKITDAD